MPETVAGAGAQAGASTAARSTTCKLLQLPVAATTATGTITTVTTTPLTPQAELHLCNGVLRTTGCMHARIAVIASKHLDSFSVQSLELHGKYP